MGRTRKVLCLGLFMLASATAVWAQSYPPAAEYLSLMELRFYETRGAFLVEGVELVFPPAGVRDATLVISRPSGEMVTSVPLRVEQMGNYPMFAMLKPNGVPGGADVGQSGEFVVSIRIGGKTVTELPFSMKRVDGSDPFNPQTEYLREGPWRELAFFSSRVDEPDSNLRFNWWMNLREMPAGVKNAHVSVHLMRGAKEIAASNSPVITSSNDWQYFHRELEEPSQPRKRYLTLTELTKQDGELTIVLKANGQPFKTFRTRIVGGKLEGLPRNKLGFEPHTAFISPRYVDVSAGTTSRYQMREMYWLRKAGK